MREGIVAPDERFYGGLLAALVPSKKFLVKCVGNKDAALAYAAQISRNDLNDTFVIVDRDYSGMTHTALMSPCVVETFGYSWENDIWTFDLCSALLAQLYVAPSSIASMQFRQLKKRLRLLSAMDCAMKLSNAALLKKSSSFGGIGFRFSDEYLVGVSDFRRLLSVFKASPAYHCSLSRDLVRVANKLPAEKVIQGHLWSNGIRGWIAHLYKAATKDTAPSKLVLLSLAISAFQADVRSIFEPTTLAHYQAQLRTVLSNPKLVV